MDDYDITKDEVESLKELASLDGATVPILAEEEYEKQISQFENFGEKRVEEDLAQSAKEQEVLEENSSLENGESEEKSADNSINTENSEKKDEQMAEIKETSGGAIDVQNKTPLEEKAASSTSESLGTAAKVFGISNEQLEAEFIKQKADRLFSKIELMLCDPFMAEAEILKRAKEAKDLGLSKISVLPALIKKVKAVTGGTIPIAVACSYPYGVEAQSTIKYAIKKAVKSGADAIEVPFVYSDICQKKTKAVAKIYEKYRKLCKTKKFVLVCEIAKMTPNEIEELAKIINYAKITSVKTSAGLEGALIDEYVLPTFKKALLAEVELIACEYKGKSENAIRAFNSGADKYASVNASSIARTIKEDLKS